MTDWNQLVRTHGSMVFGTAWRILGHSADAEDVAQEVFLEVFRLYQQRPVQTWTGLLRRMAACRALDRLRQRRYTQPLDGLRLLASTDSPEEQAIADELGTRLRQALTELTEREASVFCLRYFEHLSYQQIADILNIRCGSVAVALHKARARLEALLTGIPTGDPQ